MIIRVAHKAFIVPGSPLGSHAEPVRDSDPSCPRPDDRPLRQIRSLCFSFQKAVGRITRDHITSVL